MYRIGLFIYLLPITFIAQAVQAVITLDKRLVSAGGQTNFRDVGAYQTTDGWRIKWHEVCCTQLTILSLITHGDSI